MSFTLPRTTGSFIGVSGVIAVAALIIGLTSGAAPGAPAPPSAQFFARQQLIATPISLSAAAAAIGRPASAALPVSPARAIKAAQAVDSLAKAPLGTELVMFWIPGSQLFPEQPAWLVSWNQTTYPFGAGPSPTYAPPTPDLHMNVVVSAETGKVLAAFPSGKG